MSALKAADPETETSGCPRTPAAVPFRLPISRAERPPRAPAIYVAGGMVLGDGELTRLRLPLPPAWDDRAPGAWAAERRAKKAYWAALDALAAGAIRRDAPGQTGRLAAEVRSQTLAAGLRHLLDVFALVERTGSVYLPRPSVPWDRVVLTVPPSPQGVAVAALERRYAWALEWLRTRHYVTVKAPRIEWRVSATGDDVPTVRPDAAGGATPRPARGAA